MELDDLKDRQKADTSAAREEFTRAFDTMKWIVGLVALSNLGFGAISLFKKSKD